MYLILSDGTVYEGQGFGAAADAIGELVFTTGMVGYLETLTDPAYAGQIVLQTFPLIGNYGYIPEDASGQCRLKGYVVRSLCDTPSNFRTASDLDAYLKAQGVPGIAGIDTRSVTHRIRKQGVMNAWLCQTLPTDLEPLKRYAVRGAVQEVTCSVPCRYESAGKAGFHVVMIDYGGQRSLIPALTERGCAVTAVPADTTAEEILALEPDGLVLTGGPGDPAENTQAIRQIERLLGRLPLFGVGLGHQMTALAAGGRTQKMKHGHRGSNQPVRDLLDGCTRMTSQNHGYTVLADTVSAGTLRAVNANDGSCEGIDYPALKAFTVQFDPDSRTAPGHTGFLFDRLIDLMGGNAACR